MAGIVEKIPRPFSVQEVMEKYPVLYEESMNTVLIQEVIRYGVSVCMKLGACHWPIVGNMNEY